MSENVLLWLAIFVFAMLAIGLVLTILEFRYGQPRREADEARAKERAGKASQAGATTR
jgi:hypothetical protein